MNCAVLAILYMSLISTPSATTYLQNNDFNQGLMNWELVPQNDDVIRYEDNNVRIFNPGGKRFTAIRQELQNVKVGDLLEISAVISSDSGRARLFVSEGFKWGQNPGERRFASAYCRTLNDKHTIKTKFRVQALPVWVGIGLYRSQVSELTIYGLSVREVEEDTMDAQERVSEVKLPGTFASGSEYWQLVNHGSDDESMHVNDLDQSVSLVAREENDWVALRQVREDFMVGECIEVEADVKANHENAVLILTSGFMWGQEVDGNPYHKVKHSGNGEYEKLKASLIIQSNPLCIGLGMDRGTAMQSMTFKNLKIHRERDFLPARAQEIQDQLVHRINQGNIPSILKEHLSGLVAKITSARQRLMVSQNPDELVDGLRELRKILSINHAFMIDGKFNPEISKLADGKATLKLFNLASPHSVWYRIEVYPANTNVMIRRMNTDDSGPGYPLLEGQLVRVSSRTPALLQIDTRSVSNRSIQMKITPLDHSGGDVHSIFNLRVK